MKRSAPHPHTWSRRQFLLGAGGLAASLPWFVPARVLGLDAGALPPSERIGVGVIGVGCMGQGHLQHLVSLPQARVLAVSDVDAWRRDNGRNIVEKAYGPGSCTTHVDFQELLARQDIDAVLIALGERWHPVATVYAAEAGKDIYVEKPTALTIHEAHAMTAAVRRHGRVCQVGLQQRSSREFRLAARLVRDGAIGTLRNVYVIHAGTSSDVDLPAEPTPESLDWDRWIGPSPWRPFNSRFHYLGRPLNVVPWEFVRDFGGGSITSGCVHALDVVQWALGMDQAGPLEIIAPESGQVPFVTLRYPNDVKVEITDGRLDARHHTIPAGWDPLTSLQPFGGLYVGDAGWIHVGRQGVLVSNPAEIVKDYPAAYDHAIRDESHMVNWLECIRTRRRPNCDIAIGAQSTIVALLACIARWVGRPLKWDSARSEFVGDDEANRLRRRALRAPWHV